MSTPEKIQHIQELIKRISESPAPLPLTALNQDVYKRIKEGEADLPPFITPIDDILDRCKSEGIKVVLGKNPNSGNFFILPAGSNDIEGDSFQHGLLSAVDVENQALKDLLKFSSKK